MALKKLSSDESDALQWWVELISAAEVLTKNPAAMRDREGYARNLASRLWKDEKMVAAIATEWQQTAAEGKVAARHGARL